jgi:hypothetical protein
MLKSESPLVPFRSESNEYWTPASIQGLTSDDTSKCELFGLIPCRIFVDLLEDYTYPALKGLDVSKERPKDTTQLNILRKNIQEHYGLSAYISLTCFTSD